MRKTTIIFPPTNLSRIESAVNQLPLFRSKHDCFDVPAFGNNPAREFKNAEEMEAYLRIACQQPFGIKEHHATEHHYDFRLGWNGVLKSWAIPKGPSFCPDHCRKAIEVEDHRRKYLGFEGVYADGKPGAGPTMLWDRGIWLPQTGYFDVDKALRNGKLRFILRGAKLKGKWTLHRTGNVTYGGNLVWLLTKEFDSYARGRNEIEIVEERPESVSSGDTLEKVAFGWHEGKRKIKSEATLFEM